MEVIYLPIATNIKVETTLKKSTELNYEDLLWLFENYYNKYNRYPNYQDFTSQNNLPQWRIVVKILNNNNLTYRDFKANLLHTTVVRASKKDYQIYLQRYINICTELNRALTQDELRNNEYNLASHSYYVKYCPNLNVKTYDDFVKWCGFDSNSLKKDKNKVEQGLIDLEKRLGRPIRQYDIDPKTCGFSLQVVNRLYGSLNKAKEKLNLMPTPTSIFSLTFDEYCKELDIILNNINSTTNRKVISWEDIENPLYNSNNICRKTFLYNFSINNSDFYKYLKEKGFELNTNKVGFKHTFFDGERVLSFMEYNFSLWLKTKCNLVYNKDYFKDVKYKDFCKNYNGKMTCDYRININGKTFYIEIAGILTSVTNRNNWKECTPKGNIAIKYFEKMKEKEKILNKSQIPYIFLFPYEFKNNTYQEIIKQMMENDQR